MADTQGTFVFNGTEVKLTGRKATKSQQVQSRKFRGEKTTITDELVEVTPSRLEEGSWKKWVKLEELYTIKTDDTET